MLAVSDSVPLHLLEVGMWSLVARKWQLLGQSSVVRSADKLCNITCYQILVFASSENAKLGRGVGTRDTHCRSLFLEVFYYGFSFSVASASRLDAMRMHLFLNQSGYVSSGLVAASHKKHRGEIWCTSGCWTHLRETLLEEFRQQWRLLFDLQFRVTCSVWKEKHKS